MRVLLVGVLVWRIGSARADPIEDGVAKAIGYAASSCELDAYPKAAARYPRKDGRIPVRVVLGPSTNLTVEVLPLEQPIGFGEVWDQRTLNTCLRKYALTVLPAMPKQTRHIVYFTIDQPLSQQTRSFNEDLARRYAARALAPVAKRCRASEWVPLRAKIAADGSAVLAEDAEAGQVARCVAKTTLRFAGPGHPVEISIAIPTKLDSPTTLRDELAALAPKPTPARCYVGGCSGQVCSDDRGAITTCEWREEYACFKHARCERQRTGRCGWTETPAYKACVRSSP